MEDGKWQEYVVEKLDRVTDSISSIDKTLAVNTEQLRVLIKRTREAERTIERNRLEAKKVRDELDQEIDKVQAHVDKVDGAVRLGKWLIATATAMAGALAGSLLS